MLYGNFICHRKTENSLSDIIYRHFKMGKDTQGNKPLINYSTVQRETKLKLPSLLGEYSQLLSWAWAGTGIFLGWAPETLTLCESLEESHDHQHVSGRHLCGAQG